MAASSSLLISPLHAIASTGCSAGASMACIQEQAALPCTARQAGVAQLAHQCMSGASRTAMGSQAGRRKGLPHSKARAAVPVPQICHIQQAQREVRLPTQDGHLR